MSKQKKLREQQEQQLMRYNPRELSTIANTFNRENMELIMSIRKFFLQGDLREEDVRLLTDFAKNKDATNVMYKTILPDSDPEAPFGQIVDLWASVQTRERGPEQVMLDLKERYKTIKYLQERFERLGQMPQDDIQRGDILLKSLVYDGKKSPETAYIDIQCRNTIINHIEMQIQQLITLAERTPKSEKDIEEKYFADSSK